MIEDFGGRKVGLYVVQLCYFRWKHAKVIPLYFDNIYQNNRFCKKKLKTTDILRIRAYREFTFCYWNKKEDHFMN